MKTVYFYGWLHRFGNAASASPPARLRRNDFQRGEGLPEIRFVAGEEALEAQRKRANQDVRQRAFGRQPSAARGNW